MLARLWGLAVTALVWTLCAPGAWAQGEEPDRPPPETGSTSAEPNEAREPIEVASASRIVVIGERRNLLFIPGSGSTIEQGELERSRVFTVNEALRRVPGLYPRDEEGLGLRPNIGIRGLNPTRSTKLLLLEDGLPLTFAPYGDNASYYHPPLDRFSRIEVLKGASQIRFGPQTIGGVVNYITPDAPAEPEAKIKIASGNLGYDELDAMVGGEVGGVRLLGHANWTESEGARENLDLGFEDYYVKAETEIASNQWLTLRLNHFSENSQITYSGLTLAEFLADSYANPFANDRFDTKRSGYSATHAWDVNAAMSLKTSAYFSSFDREWWRQSSNSGQRPNDSSDPVCGGMANLSTTCGNEGRLRYYESWGIETRLSADWSAFGAGASSEFGARYHSEEQTRFQWNGDTPFARTPGISINAGVMEDNRRFLDAWSAFAATRFAFGDFSIQPGIRAEWIDYERRNLLNGTAATTDLSEVIPGLGITYALRRKLVLYAGAHRGFAPPRVEDILTNAGGSNDLDAEESTNYELGIRGEFWPGLNGDFALFRLDFKNQIIPASVAGGVGSTLTSAGETLHEGAELALDLSLAAADAGSWFPDGDNIFGRVAATFLWTAEFEGRRFSNISGFNCTGIVPPLPGPTCVLVSGNRLPYAPEWIGSAAVGYDWRGIITAEIEVQFTDEMFTDDLNTTAVTANGQRGLIKSATIWNAAVNITPPGSGVTFFVTAKNLFDELYVVDRSRGILPGAPFLIQAGISVEF